MRLRALLPLLVIALAGCAAQPESCALVPVASMPLEAHDNLLFVTVGIGDKPVRMVVDTGAVRTTLTEAAVARLALPHDPHFVTRSVGIGGASANRDADIPGLVLGHVRFPVQHVVVGDFHLDHLEDPPVDGLLGADVLLGFDLDIDPSAHRLTLYRARHCPGAEPPWQHEAAIRIPGIEARRDRLLVPITLDGVSGMAILDTGAQATAISEAMARRLGLSRATLEPDRTVLMLGTAPQPASVHEHRFHDLLVGGIGIADPSLGIVPDASLIGDALLGGDFLRGRRVWLSFPTLRLFVSADGRGLAEGR